MIGLAKFMKGSTTLTELENMPNKCIQALWKLYVDTMRDDKKKEAMQSEESLEEIADAVT